MCSTVMPIEGMSDGELTDQLVALDRERSRIEAQLLAVAAEIDLRRVYAADGARVASSWIAERTDLSKGQASMLVKHGRLLRSHDASAAALEPLGCTKVRAVLAAVNDRTRDAFDRDEAILLNAIEPLTVDQTRTLVAAWAQRVDQEGVDPKPPRHSEVHLRRTFDGWWDLQGRLDPAMGAAVAAAIRSEAERLWRAEAETAEGHRHTPAERNAIALADLVARGVDPDRDDTREPPTALVVIGLDDLRGDGDGDGEVVGGGPISAETARRLTCDAKVCRVLVDTDGAILDKGRATRTATRDQRHALTVRDRGCVFPGCDRPPGWCDAHHIRHWTRDLGPTDLWNLVLLCSHHHHLLHEGGWSIERAGPGWIFRRPDGSILEPHRRAAA
jgi:hypothetical protein